MSKTYQLIENYKKLIIEFPRSKRKVLIELYNCDEEYLAQVKKIINVHPANHSIALFLKMKDKADLCAYYHPLLADDKAKEFVTSYVSKFSYPLVIITRMENIEQLFLINGIPTKFRRWCTRMFKIEPALLFYKKYIDSGVIEYIGIQKFQSKERSEMNPELIEDAKSQKRYKVYREMPIYYNSEEYNLELINKAGLEPYKEQRGYNRYGCFLCPFASESYYLEMKQENPELYGKCQSLMEIGSKNGNNKDHQYYYYRKSKIM